MPKPAPPGFRGNWRFVARALTALFFVLAGVNHFIHPAFYARIIPPNFPDPVLLVRISGAFEIAGGVGLLIAPLRLIAGWGLIALLVAVFPANLYMAQHPDVAGFRFPVWILLVRLPLQGVLVFWVWFISRHD